MSITNSLRSLMVCFVFLGFANSGFAFEFEDFLAIQEPILKDLNKIQKEYDEANKKHLEAAAEKERRLGGLTGEIKEVLGALVLVLGGGPPKLSAEDADAVVEEERTKRILWYVKDARDFSYEYSKRLLEKISPIFADARQYYDKLKDSQPAALVWIFHDLTEQILLILSNEIDFRMVETRTGEKQYFDLPESSAYVPGARARYNRLCFMYDAASDSLALALSFRQQLETEKKSILGDLIEKFSLEPSSSIQLGE
ncbi:MAG: hypothetical protein AB7F43_05740 [Bacteriovoracia bacterium]